VECLDHYSISEWNWETETTELLFKPEGVVSNNGTKGNPCLSGDILGDWREEVIWASKSQTELRIYTTTVPATDRRPTLMSDRQYRLAIAWQNVAYNQPPHTSY
jgi:rhamnogalacturonan endolyase